MRSLTRKTIKIFWRHAKRYTWMPYTLFFTMIGVTILRDIPPLLYRRVIDALVEKPADQAVKIAIGAVALAFALNFFRIALWRGINFLNNYFQPRVMADLTNTCYEYLQKHSLGFFSSNFIGSLVTKVKRFERSFEQLADQFFFNLGRSFVDLVIIVAILSWRFWTLGLLMFGWAVTYILVVYFFARFKLPYDIKRAAIDSETTGQLADTMSNNFNIKIFANYLLEFVRFRKVTDRQFQARKKSYNLGTIGEIFQSVYMISLEFGMMYYAIRLWQNGVMTVGDIALIQAYLFRIFDQLWDMGKNIRTIYEAAADANEMTEILLTGHEVQDASRAANLEIKKGEIKFRNVYFAYHEGMEILKDFNLTIKPGERVAFIGPSGGGKSTVVKLLFRFYDIQGGEILIEGKNIAAVTQDSLRANVALVPQEPILFHRSLIDNIRYARPGASDAEVIKAAKLAHAHEFISGFPEGYNTFVGERGVKLSGGERQRVAIARAILKNAPILVLDEATSSLDSESEMYIQDALKKLMKGRTTIVIAHRLSTIMQMDRIIVMENGKIMEQGSHHELLKVQQGVYQRLWNIQAGGFAAA